jgi:hypothetical protein
MQIVFLLVKKKNRLSRVVDIKKRESLSVFWRNYVFYAICMEHATPYTFWADWLASFYDHQWEMRMHL